MPKRNISLIELCDSISEECKVLGAGDRYVSIASPIDKSDKDSVTFCSKHTRDALPMIRNSTAGIIICSRELNYQEDDYKDKTLILVSNPRLAFIQVMQKYFQEKPKFGIHPSAVIDEDAKVHHNVHIGPNTCIMGKCEIGENTIIYGNVYIYPNVRIGRNVIIHAGTVIGSEGFGLERNERGELENFPQLGGVTIDDDVDIGSNVSIDHGTLENTIIGTGTKIDNLTHISHNDRIGKHCQINALVVICGSVVIEDYSHIAPHACVREGLLIGHNVLVGMGSVVTKDIEDNLVVMGVPARVVRKQPEPTDNKED